MNENVTLSGVPETMLQTLYARAKESRGRGVIHDAKAEEIVASSTTISPTPTRISSRIFIMERGSWCRPLQQRDNTKTPPVGYMHHAFPTGGYFILLSYRFQILFSKSFNRLWYSAIRLSALPSPSGKLMR